jgi:clan AA aspartic protease (TIGR02281 family)
MTTTVFCTRHLAEPNGYLPLRIQPGPPLDDTNKVAELPTGTCGIVRTGPSVVVGQDRWAEVTVGNVTGWVNDYYIGRVVPTMNWPNHEVNKAPGTLPPLSEDRSVQIGRDELSGQFFAQVLINGQTVRMLVDTGAWTVMLCPDDAKQIGVSLDKLSYSLSASMADGSITHAAPIKLSNLFVQLIGLSDVVAVVASERHDKCVSLLGMSFLGRLKSYEFSGDTLTLRG